MRIIGILVVIWLAIGAIAGGQRGYYDGSSTNCARFGDIAATIFAGPLNYTGVNPKLNCHMPKPSS